MWKDTDSPLPRLSRFLGKKLNDDVTFFRIVKIKSFLTKF